MWSKPTPPSSRGMKADKIWFSQRGKPAFVFVALLGPSDALNNTLRGRELPALGCPGGHVTKHPRFQVADCEVQEEPNEHEGSENFTDWKKGFEKLILWNRSLLQTSGGSWTKIELNKMRSIADPSRTPRCRWLNSGWNT